MCQYWPTGNFGANEVSETIKIQGIKLTKIHTVYQSKQ